MTHIANREKQHNKKIDRHLKMINEIEDCTLVRKINKIDINKPYSIIEFELNTKPAFPDMPDSK
jgi:hypothetical protein